MKQRWKQIVLSVVLAAVMLLPVLPAVAQADTEEVKSTIVSDDVTITLETDKDSYKSGDTVNVTVTLKNDSKLSLNSGKFGCKVEPGKASSKNFPPALPIVGSGKTGEVKGSFVISLKDGEGGSSSDGSDSDDSTSGSSVGVVIAIVVVVAAVGVAVFAVLKKKGKNPPTAMFIAGLIVVLCGVSVAGTTKVSADDDYIYVGKEVKCDGKKVVVKATITMNFGEKVQSIDASDKVDYKTVAVHDPSIIKADGKYYVFGSHQAVGVSEDLKNWTNVNFTYANNAVGNTAYDVSAYSGNVSVLRDGKIVEVPFKDGFGNPFNGRTYAATYVNNNLATDAQKQAYLVGEKGGTNLWAPDVIYNKTMGKYCMYMSLNGQKWNSVIVLLTSDSITGPYEYQGPVVYSGFSNNSSKSTYYKYTDLELVCGPLDSLPAKYDKADSGKWGDFHPHCIDPAVTYDDDGNLWMVYGSWSGGIYVLQLDENTGLRDYTVKYENDGDGFQGVRVDEYYGKKIAGGYYVSGEGPYIEKIGDYYWLFVSYGFYEAGTGYNMRVYRSETIDGDYVDARGFSAVFKAWKMTHASAEGVRLFGGYKWPYMIKGSTAQGHNSAFVDDDGKAYVVYHRKFDDGTQGHQVETHQLFLNKEGWLVAAPFKYGGETISETGYDKSELVGDYDVILHTKVNYTQAEYDSKKALDIHSSKMIKLNEDGTVTGDYTGTWTAENGTCYMTIEFDGETYSGVFAKGFYEESTLETMTFTALGTKYQTTLWGAKVLPD